MISFTFLLHVFFLETEEKALRSDIGDNYRQAKLALPLGAYLENI